MIPIEALSFPVSYLQLCDEICAARGVDAKRYYADEMGLTDSQLSDPQGTISGENFHKLLGLIADFIREKPEHQQLLMEFFPATIHGYVALAAMTSETVVSALEVAIRYAHQIMPAFELSHEVSGEQCHIHFKRVAELGAHNDLMTEMVFCAAHSFLRMLGQSKVEIDLSLAHENILLTELPSLYSKLHIETSCTENRLSFPAKYLNDKLATRNEATRQAIEQALENNELRLSQEHSLSYQVSAIILSRIQQQQLVEAKDIAKQLTLSPRTFNRRLLDEGNNFRQLYNDCRCNIGKDLLSSSNLTISQISEQLGFSDEANFSRFFKNQTGLSPRTFRQTKV
ncbi:MAG: AraC family transcriptional regulator [Pseudomonadales bacterium]|nr:AraC family transcriptional regulator [Pseudomonadales bacterium]